MRGDDRGEDSYRLPPGERPRFVAARRFRLDYELDASGPRDLARVELWGTRDAGRSWQSHAAATGPNEPLPVSVESEGLYGFRLTVADFQGRGQQPPRDGDLPELWVIVDETPPRITITRATPLVRDTGNVLLVEWQASDRHLLPRPISLSASHHADGPWFTIAAGLENVGSHAWPIDSRWPRQIFLRIEARDQAGNVGTDQTAVSLEIDTSPRARLREVHPVR